MRLLMIGAPGAGKGTQAEQIATHFGLTHISSGDLFRQHVARKTAIGRVAKAYLQRGDLVPDAVVMDMLYKPVTKANQGAGYVLDGFPRTVEQAEAAYSVAKDLGVAVQAAVHLEVPTDDLVERLVARGQATGRTDDTEEVITHRLEVYAEKTTPLLNYYREREQLVTVNGARAIDEVTWSVIVQLQRLQRQLSR
jgi:adenylate kinase